MSEKSSKCSSCVLLKKERDEALLIAKNVAAEIVEIRNQRNVNSENGGPINEEAVRIADELLACLELALGPNALALAEEEDQVLDDIIREKNDSLKKVSHLEEENEKLRQRINDYEKELLNNANTIIGLETQVLLYRKRAGI